MANTIRASKNTFSGGLVMDLSPDNTPNEVLTSALNATLVTFNGNEMSLQNDMGNGRVETARLPDGYIPVGTCEFGDIIYIVSYNPLTNKSQIGCFPSPERNISSEEVGSTGQQLSVNDFQILGENDRPTGELITNSVKKVIYENKLNPGDKFIIYNSGISLDNGNTDCLTDKGNTSHIYGNFPKLVRIHVVALEDSGKIVYLDSTLRWYDKPNSNDYFISGCAGLAGAYKPDIDSYRNMLSSGYSVFLSKVSGKLALLIELEKIKGFSCTYNTYLSENTTTNDNITSKDCKVFWNINWETEDVNINPSHVVLTESEMTGNVLSLAGQIGYYTYDSTKKEYVLKFETSYVTENNLLPVKYPTSGYWHEGISLSYDPSLATTYDNFINGNDNNNPEGASYLKHLEQFLSSIESSDSGAYDGQSLQKLNIERTNNNGYRSIPIISNNKGNYYINATYSEYVGNQLKIYTQSSNDGSRLAISAKEISDDIVNNYFHNGVYKEFATFPIPIKQVVQVTDLPDQEFTPDISNLIYHYQLTPAMSYGLLREYAVDGYIDFSKIGSGKIDVTGWKYFNTENTSTLTMNLDAYVEENMGVAEVVLEFYDNQGFAAGYHIKNRESFSGLFTEYIPLNGYTLSYKLNALNYKDEEKVHAGAEITSLEGITQAVKLTSAGTSQIVYIKDNKAYNDEGCTVQYNGKVFYNDCGTLYSNIVYLVKIIVKYCPYDSLGELDTLDESKFETFYRWYWTNTMYNQYYYNTQDFDLLKFNLTLDLQAKYSSTLYYKYGKFKYSPNYPDVINSSDDLYKTLSANVQVVTALTNKNNNLQVSLEAGLLYDYNTFSLRRAPAGLAPAYAETNISVDIITDGDRYVENSPDTVELLHAGEGLMTSNNLQPICSNDAFDLSYVGPTLKNSLNDYISGLAGTGNELWTDVTSYESYKNQFELNFVGTSTQISNSLEQYITYTNEIKDLNNKHRITKQLKDIYDDNSLLMLTNIIHYSKYLPLKNNITGSFKKVVPIINNIDNLQNFGLTINNEHIHILHHLIMHWWNDRDGTDEHFRVYDYPGSNMWDSYQLKYVWYFDTASYQGYWEDDWDGRPDFSIYRDGTREQFYNDKRSDWMNFILGKQGFILTAFVPPRGYGSSGFYVNKTNAAEATSENFGANFSNLFKTSGYLSNYVDSEVENHLGAWHGTPDNSRILVNISFQGDKLDSFHFLNNWGITYRWYDILHYSDNTYWASKYPAYIGDSIASVLGSILVYSSTASSNITYNADVVYLAENYTIYTKDIIYKMYVTTNDLETLNSLINISGLEYDSYLNAVLVNSGNSENSKISRHNVDVKLLTIIKNCPLLLRLNYVTPDFGILGNVYSSTIKVDPLDRNAFDIEGEVQQDKLYYVKNDGGTKYLQPLDSGFTPILYKNFINVSGILKADISNDYPQFSKPFPEIEKTFEYSEGTFKIKRSTPPATGQCYSLITKEEGWMTIFDVYKQDMILPYLNPFE